MPITGFCVGRAVNHLTHVAEARPLPDGCDWRVQETAFPGDLALLYLAASCNGVTTRLDAAGGARFGELTFATSALTAHFGGPPRAGERFALIGTADADTAIESIEAYARSAMEEGEQAARCVAQPLREADAPPDAYVVDVTLPRAAAEGPKDPECGPYGAMDSGDYWRVFGGFAWYLILGQDAWQDVDPASLTLFERDPAIGWKVVQ